MLLRVLETSSGSFASLVFFELLASPAREAPSSPTPVSSSQAFKPQSLRLKGYLHE